MDSIKFDKLICKNMKSIFGFALTRLENVTEAECLASDILYEIIRSAQNLKDEERFYGFIWKIAENTYMDYLRKKARNASRTAELDKNLADESESALEDIVKKEELNLLRRELSLLSKQYRDTTVLYYIENFSCSEISQKLNISTEMVKYYLFRARKIIREGMDMERLYGEKSYRPSSFEIDFWGTKSGDDLEYRDFQRRKIKGNILLAAYYTPVTIQEISIELGVALPYLEDEISLLIDRGYMTYKGGKYQTNIPIFTLDCSKAIDEKLSVLTKNAAKRFTDAIDKFDSRFGSRFENQNLARWQKILLCLHYSLINTEHALEKKYSELPDDGPYSILKDGGRGIIWGRSFETSTSMDDDLPHGIQGIYNGCHSSDNCGSVIAMNFRQTLNAQHFEYQMTDSVVNTALGFFESLSSDWQKILDDLGYAKGGKANFAVWTYEEYTELRDILTECTDIVSELNQKTSEVAANITADFAPANIRKTAEYVGAFVYRFNSIENLVNALFDIGWLKPLNDKDKPAVCVIKN
ncbi:MAG: sigma-70 family RNA polymerase sigma factor [Ruminococcaceae bacterium]|nr:sigma-70 family RNA polymerase sigma factor [Oscillospiraceae bacterium]